MKLTVVDAQDDGIRLDRWFSRYYPAVTQGQLQKALRQKLVRVDGKRAEAGQRLAEGQIIKHPDFVTATAAPVKITLTPQKIEWVKSLILYQDENLLALNKPAGLATQGGSGVTEHIDALLPALQGEAPHPPRLVHRLDRDTSGVLLLARDTKTAAMLSKLLATQQTQKTYWALVVGVPVPNQGRIEAPLAKQSRGGQEKMVVDIEEGKKSITEYRVVERLGQQLSWVELHPLTGRTHQLRVHMESIGHPIVGDGKYGGQTAFPEGLNLPRQLHLHARTMVIPEYKGRSLKIEAPLSPHMRQSWDMLGLAVID